MKGLAIAAPLILMTVALAGCTGGGDADPYVTPGQDENGRYIIKMLAAQRYEPKFAKVPVGATVLWVNEGGSHNVVPDGHTGFQGSQVTAQLGDHLVHTFEIAGDYPYYCEPHKSVGMNGVLRVE